MSRRYFFTEVKKGLGSGGIDIEAAEVGVILRDLLECRGRFGRVRDQWRVMEVIQRVGPRTAQVVEVMAAIAADPVQV